MVFLLLTWLPVPGSLGAPPEFLARYISMLYEALDPHERVVDGGQQRILGLYCLAHREGKQTLPTPEPPSCVMSEAEKANTKILGKRSKTRTTRTAQRLRLVHYDATCDTIRTRHRVSLARFA